MFYPFDTTSPRARAKAQAANDVWNSIPVWTPPTPTTSATNQQALANNNDQASQASPFAITASNETTYPTTEASQAGAASTNTSNSMLQPNNEASQTGPSSAYDTNGTAQSTNGPTRLRLNPPKRQKLSLLPPKLPKAESPPPQRTKRLILHGPTLPENQAAHPQRLQRLILRGPKQPAQLHLHAPKGREWLAPPGFGGHLPEWAAPDEGNPVLDWLEELPDPYPPPGPDGLSFSAGFLDAPRGSRSISPMDTRETRRQRKRSNKGSRLPGGAIRKPRRHGDTVDYPLHVDEIGNSWNDVAWN